MRKFLIALQFLTSIPVRTKSAMDKNKLAGAAVYFPLVGLLLGLILATANKLLYVLGLEELLANTLLVTLLIILTAGLHLDGLADTFDALLSRKARPEMLKIMRDSRIGTMGVLSLICIILLKLSLLCALDLKMMNVSLILMCLLSRYSLVLSMFSFPYVREEGKAKVFIEGMNTKIFSLATAITLFCVLVLLGLKGLIPFIMVMLFTILTGKFIAKKIGGITGDTLGAINELTEVFVLLNMLILTRLGI
ncbi:MAG: adenosylcobinamide-GDP ribazoletransferase [Candidatus Omnitrophica bacterium]|nr:adenosylcobinamide-GDP ribazoletransferase [Candidatus Omnitrophota bacterium]